MWPAVRNLSCFPKRGATAQVCGGFLAGRRRFVFSTHSPSVEGCSLPGLLQTLSWPWLSAHFLVLWFCQTLARRGWSQFTVSCLCQDLSAHFPMHWKGNTSQVPWCVVLDPTAPTEAIYFGIDAEFKTLKEGQLGGASFCHRGSDVTLSVFLSLLTMEAKLYLECLLVLGQDSGALETSQPRTEVSPDSLYSFCLS